MVIFDGVQVRRADCYSSHIIVDLLLPEIEGTLYTLRKEFHMITERTIWRIIEKYMPRKEWVSTAEMNHIVEMYGNLGDEDWQPLSSRSKTPSWRVRVRRVLANRIKEGIIRSRKRME
jgi:hypothetical protein